MSIENFRHFLIVRNDRLGDAILALPVVTALKELFPNALISFLASPYTAPIIECVENVTRVFKADDRHAGSIVEELSNAGITCAICLRPTLSNAISLFRARIPIRIGTAYRAYSLLFSEKIKIHRRGQSIHETELNLKLIARLGQSPLPKFPKIDLPASSLESAGKLVGRTSAPLVVLHPGSGGSARNWSIDQFASLAKLFKLDGRRVIATGSTAEREKCARIGISGEDNLAGQTDLLTLAGVLRQADIVISNSTGPLHLANAIGVPVLGLYPPLDDCLPSRWGPYGNLNRSIMPDVPICHKCHRGRASDCWCLEQLSPESVFEKAKSIVSQTSTGNGE